jgi:hypothetical protein
MGLIAAISARAIPTLNQQSRAIELGSELRDYVESILGRAEAERLFLAPDNFTGVPQYMKYTDSNGNRWGYMVTRDMTTKNGLCTLDPKQKIAIVYCKTDLDSCKTVSDISSFVEDVAAVMFSSDASFKQRVRFYTKNVTLNPVNYSLNVAQAVSADTVLTASDFNNANNAVIMKIAAPATKDPVDDTVLDFTYQEVWDRVGCPPLRSVTEGDILDIRGARYQNVDSNYDFVALPINFLDIQGAEYCFESYEGITTDFGLAKTFERDVWEGAETNFRNSRVGYDAGGGVPSSGFTTNSSGNNYCNRGNNRMPTVNNCSGNRTQTNWLNSGRTFSKWYKDEAVADGYGYNRWMFCGGNGAWNSLDVSSGGNLEDYQIRLRPGYRSNTSDTSDHYRINNRSFKAYARIPGSRALYKQAFTTKVRGYTHFWYYDWPVTNVNPDY